MSANIIVVVVLCKVKWETGLTTATFTRFFPLGNKPLHWKQYCWRLSLSLSLFGSAAFSQYAIFKSWLNDVPKIWVLSKREKEPLRLQANTSADDDGGGDPSVPCCSTLDTCANTVRDCTWLCRTKIAWRVRARPFVVFLLPRAFAASTTLPRTVQES